MTMTEKSRTALEDAIWFAIENDADRDDIISEVAYILDIAAEEGEL